MTALSLSTRVLHADLDTPVSAFLKLRPLATTSFLYESVEGLGNMLAIQSLESAPNETYRVRDQLLTIQSSTSTKTEPAQDPLTAIRQAWDAYRLKLPEDTPSFVGGIFGYLSYDAVRSFEPLGPKATPPDVDDAMFIEPEPLAVFDNREQTLTLYAEEDEWLERGSDALRGQLPEQSQPIVSQSQWRAPVAKTSKPPSSAQKNISAPAISSRPSSPERLRCRVSVTPLISTGVYAGSIHRPICIISRRLT